MINPMLDVKKGSVCNSCIKEGFEYFAHECRINMNDNDESFLHFVFIAGSIVAANVIVARGVVSNEKKKH